MAAKPTLALIVCGDRCASYDIWRPIILRCLNHLQEKYTIVCLWHANSKRGIDKIVDNIAGANNIPRQVVPADWSQGRKAGPLRNRQMLRQLQALQTDQKMILAFHPQIEKSRGSANMIAQARKVGITSLVINSGNTSYSLK